MLRRRAKRGGRVYSPLAPLLFDIYWRCAVLHRLLREARKAAMLQSWPISRTSDEDVCSGGCLMGTDRQSVKMIEGTK